MNRNFQGKEKKKRKQKEESQPNNLNFDWFYFSKIFFNLFRVIMKLTVLLQCSIQEHYPENIINPQ